MWSYMAATYTQHVTQLNLDRRDVDLGTITLKTITVFAVLQFMRRVCAAQLCDLEPATRLPSHSFYIQVDT